MSWSRSHCLPIVFSRSTPRVDQSLFKANSSAWGGYRPYLILSSIHQWSFKGLNFYRTIKQIVLNPERDIVIFCLQEGGTVQSSSSAEDGGETTQVRTGKWKVPSCRDYLDLFRGILDCENLRVSVNALHNMEMYITLISAIAYSMWTHVKMSKCIIIKYFMCTFVIHVQRKLKCSYMLKHTIDLCVWQDTGFLDGALESQNSNLTSLNRLLYDEVVKSIMKIIEKLDLSVQRVNTDEEAQQVGLPDSLFCSVLFCYINIPYT